jgi:hypothetical protein
VNKIILILFFFAFQQAGAQVLPVWYKDHNVDIREVNFSKLTNNHSDFSLVKVVDTVSVPEVVTIIVLNENGKFSQELNFDVAAYCNSKDNIIAGKRIKGRLLLGVTDLKGSPVIPVEYLKIRYAKNLFALKNQESLWALYNSKGNKITEFEFTDMLFTPYGKVKVKNKNGVGILNEDGTGLIELIYGDINQLSADSFQVKDHDLWECIDHDKKVKFKWVADSIKELNDSLCLFYLDEKVFIKDSLGKIVGSAKGYQKLEKLNDQFIKISVDDYSGLIDFSGNEILSASYYDFQFDKTGHIRALGDEVKALRFGDVVNKNKKRWSLHDSKGKKLLSNRYKSIRSFSEGLAAIQTNENLWGFVDGKGIVIIEPKFKFVSDVKNGLLLVKLPDAEENDFRLINRKEQVLYTGKEAQLFYLGVIRERICQDSIQKEGEPTSEMFYGVPPYRYDSYTLAEYGYIRIRNGPYKGILHPLGEEVVQAYQDTVYLASEDTFFLYKRNDGLVGYSDKYCHTTMSLTNKFEQVQPLKNGYSRFKKDELFGFIDPYGNVQIAPKYSASGEFSDGMAAVFLKGKWGYIDKVENLVVQPYYKETNPFRNGFAPVKTNNNKWIFIDKKGKPINSTQYDRFEEVKNGKYLVQKNKRYGITDSKGKEILSPKYEYVEELSDIFLKIKKDGKYGVMDYQENIILYYQYGEVFYNSYWKSFFVKREGESKKICILKK